MASLTQISINTRRVIRYGIYLIILIIIARYALRIGTGIYHKIFPPKEPEPTLAFGKLPLLTLPPKERPVDLSFKLELPEGKLPILPKLTEIYSMPAASTNIKVLDTAKTKASGLGFDPEGKPIVETIPNVYIFQKRGLPATLTMNIITGIFSINYNISQNPSVLSGTPPQETAAIDLVRSFLSGGGLLGEEFKDAPVTTTLLKVQGGEYVKALSLSESNLIKVNFFRKGYGKEGKVPAITPNMPEANIWFLIAGRSRQIIAGEYKYFPLDKEKSGTYPLITAEEALDELNKGNGFIANLGENTNEIIIREVYLAYYDAGQYSQYYQPAVVFKGDNDFYAFVPAVKPEHYGAEPETPSN